jgi:hypothetical protein
MTKVVAHFTAVIGIVLLVNLCVASVKTTGPEPLRYDETDYKIITGESLQQLEANVKDQIGGSSWHLVGAISCFEGDYCQVMVRRK